MDQHTLLQDWFNVVLDHSPEALMAMKAVRGKHGEILDLEFLIANQKTLAIARRAELVGKYLTEEFPGTKKPGGFFEKYCGVIETRKPWAGEMYYEGEDLNFWLYVSVAPMDDGCIVSFMDITDKKESHDKIKQQAYFIEQVMAMAPDIITVLELPAMTMIYSNEQNLAYHGFDRDAMVNMTMEERRALIHPADSGPLAQFFATFQGNIADDEIVSCEYRAKNKSGDWLWFSVRSKVFERHADGTVRSIVNLIQNITARKLSELQIRESKDLLEGITGVIPDMISVQAYPSRDIIFFNRDAFSLLGWDPEEMIRLDASEKNTLIHPGDWEELQKYWDSFRNLPDNEITTFDYRANVETRGWIWLRARGKVFERHENGQVKSILNVIQDITDRKYSEMKVQQLNKALVLNNKALESANSEIKMFSQIAAKDYSETLRHLYTNLEHIISLDARRLSDSGRASLRRAQSAIQKMRLLTDDLMAYTKLQDPGEKRQEVDINVLLQTALMDFEKLSHVFKHEINCEQISVFGYPSMISILFHHLLDNAIKFRKDDYGHKVKISCRKNVHGSTIKYKGALDTLDYHVITITDNGVGFSQEEEDRIFEIFTRLHEKSKYKGSGIGLAVCKKVMDMHGGFLVAESLLGEGASFHCYFPV